MKQSAVFLSLLLVGCGHTLSKRPMLSDGAHLRAEPQEIWTRPVEVSYHLGDEVVATSETVTLFGLHASGDRVQTAGAVNVFGTNVRGLSANTRYAIGNIVDEQSADGFYLIYVEEESRGVLRRVRKARVRGYLLTMESHGEISEERADLDRFGHPPSIEN